MHVPREVETLPEAYADISTRLDARVTVAVDGSFDVAVDVFPLGPKTILSLRTALPVVLPFKEQIGCFKHFARSLQWLVDNSEESDIIAVLPDDLTFHPHIDAQKAIETALRSSNVGYCAVYTPRELGRRNRWKHNGWAVSKGGWDSSYGGGYFFRREVAQRVLSHPFFIDHRDNYEGNQQIDHCIPEVIHRLGLKQLFHVPSLTKHIGLTSTIGHVHTEAEEPWGWK